MNDNIVPAPCNVEKQLSIFVTDKDRRSTELSEIGDFIFNSITALTEVLKDTPISSIEPAQPADISIVQEVIRAGKSLVKGDYEYLLDFDSLPQDILKKFRDGTYPLGESRQVANNLRATIVNEAGVRVKDVTVKKVPKVADTAGSMQTIMIQMQLKQINDKLDAITEMQSYHIDFSRNNALVVPFFNARDKVVHAQNETNVGERRRYLDEAVSELEGAINALYVDIQTVRKRFLLLTKLPVFRLNKVIDQYIGYMAQDLQLLAKYNSVLIQIFNYMGKGSDRDDAYNKYRNYLLGFYTEGIGAKQLPLSLQIHNAYNGYTEENMNAWFTMTKELVPALQNNSIVDGAYLITSEDEADEVR